MAITTTNNFTLVTPSYNKNPINKKQLIISSSTELNSYVNFQDGDRFKLRHRKFEGGVGGGRWKKWEVERLRGGRRRRVAVMKGGGEVERKKYRVAERYKVVVVVAIAMCLCNADRVVMSVAVVPWAHTFGWTTSFIGVVQSSFLWGYVISSVIGGALADKYGGKTLISWGLTLWSLLTLLTPFGAYHSSFSLLIVRALFGLAQGVAIPSMNLLLSRWFPVHERARAIGISMAGFQLGNVVGLCLAPNLMHLMGISSPFVLFSCIGLLWLVLSSFGVTDDPSQSSLISDSELQLIQSGKMVSVVAVNDRDFPSVKHLLSKRPCWAIIFANFSNNWGYFVLLSWMPIYFKTVLQVDLKQAAWFSAVPWGVMAVSSYAAGATSDFLIETGCPLIVARKIMQSIGFIGPGVSLLCLNYAKTPGLASVILTVALSLGSFSQAGYLLNIQDVAPRSTGLLHGISNAVGTLAAIISTIGTGCFVEWLGSFRAFLTLTALLYFTTTVFYNLYAVGKPVV